MGTKTTVPNWVTLTRGEQILWSGNPTLRSALISLIGRLGLMGSAIAGFLTFSRTAALFGRSAPLLKWFVPVVTLLKWLTLVPLVGGVLSLVLLFARYRSIKYVLTNKAVYKRTGLLTRSVSKLRVDRIQHTSYTQSVLARLLTYGTITIETAGAGGTGIELTHVPNPAWMNDRLCPKHGDAHHQQPGGRWSNV